MHDHVEAAARQDLIDDHGIRLPCASDRSVSLSSRFDMPVICSCKFFRIELLFSAIAFALRMDS